MTSYLDLFKEQLRVLPDSIHKKQLSKYGEIILSDIVDKSILGIISEINTTEEVGFSFHKADCTSSVNKTLPVVSKLSYDLGIYEQFVLGKQVNLARLEESISDINMNINNNFVNLVNSEIIKTLSLTRDKILSKKYLKRLLMVGNGVFGKEDILKPEETSGDLKYLGKTKVGDVVFHSSCVPFRTIISIDLCDKKCLEYKMKSPLALVNNNFIHEGQMEIVDSDLITRYTLK
jgi:hypothetical protein